MNNLKHFSGKEVTLRIIYKEPDSYEDRVVEVTGVLDYELKLINVIAARTEKGRSLPMYQWYISYNPDYFNPCSRHFDKGLDFATIEYDGLIIATSRKTTTLYDMLP